MLVRHYFRETRASDDRQPCSGVLYRSFVAWVVLPRWLWQPCIGGPVSNLGNAARLSTLSSHISMKGSYFQWHLWPSQQQTVSILITPVYPTTTFYLRELLPRSQGAPSIQHSYFFICYCNRSWGGADVRIQLKPGRYHLLAHLSGHFKQVAARQEHEGSSDGSGDENEKGG